MSEKRNVAFCILEILRNHSSADNRLSKREICDILKSKYNRECDLRTVRTALDSLLRFGYDIKYRTIERNSGNGMIRTDWYMEKLFTKEESAAIILSLKLNSSLSENRIADIEKKLFHMLTDSDIFDIVTASSSKINYSVNITDTLDTVHRAIKEHLMLTFSIIEHRLNEKISLERNCLGQVKEYLFKPCGIVCYGGMANLYGEIGDTGVKRYFPIERLYMPKLTDITFTKTTKEIPLPNNKLERKNRNACERERAVIVVKNEALGDIYDNLGANAKIISAYNGKTELEINAPLKALEGMILHLGSKAEVISPTKLRRAVALELRTAGEQYKVWHKFTGHLN